MLQNSPRHISSEHLTIPASSSWLALLVRHGHAEGSQSEGSDSLPLLRQPLTCVRSRGRRQGSEAPGASGSSGPSTPTPASCLSSLRSCGGGQPAPRPRLGSAAKAGLSVPTLRPARSADLCVDAEPGGSGRNEGGGGGGGGGAGRDPKAGSDPGMPSAPPSPPLMQGLHSISVVAMALLHPCLEVRRPQRTVPHAPGRRVGREEHGR